MKIKKILVPVDGSKTSKNAVSYASYLAKNLGSSITIYHQPDLTYFQNVAISPAMQDAITKDAKSIVNDAVKIVKKAGVSCQWKIGIGQNPAKDILRFSKKHGFDQIIMGSRGMSTAAEIFLGSVSHHVVQKSTVPVTIVQ